MLQGTDPRQGHGGGATTSPSQRIATRHPRIVLTLKYPDVLAATSAGRGCCGNKLRPAPRLILLSGAWKLLACYLWPTSDEGHVW